MSGSADITAILTCHREGVLAGPSFVSFSQAIAAARDRDISVEAIIVLDRPDDATRQQFSSLNETCRLMEVDTGDPGLARNAAVSAASGDFVGFLDGDDLWSRNWLWAAHELCRKNPGTTIAHSEANVIFGQARQVWWHVDSLDPAFEAGYLRVGNYWDSMSFGHRELYKAYPYRANDLARGFAHEDWHWNCVTLSAGIEHRPVPGTVHFKRRRPGSQMMLSNSLNAVPWLTPLASYGWSGKSREHLHKE